MIVGTKEYFIDKYGEETIQNWIDSVEMEELMDCMDAFSNASFVNYKLHHRDRHLNILEMILQEDASYLYRNSTYGVQPNNICTDAIGHITGRKYGNLEIAKFLIQENISELKKWLLQEYCFSEKEEKLLHFFKERKGIFLDELDDYYNDVDRFDIENWFNNKSSHKKYIVTGKAERWDVKGMDAYGYIEHTFDSILDAIDECMDGCGICYIKIYENPYGRLFVDVCHHDGHNQFEIREITKKGKERLYNAEYDEDIVKILLNNKKYTKNVHWRKNY